MTASGTPLVAYRAFFHHVQFLQATANAVSATAGPAALRSYWQMHIGLSDKEAAQLNDIAAAHVPAIDAIEQQAATVIRNYRGSYTEGRLPTASSLPAPPAELGQLQKQRDDLTSIHIQNLRNAFSADSFARLDAYIKSNYLNHATMPSGLRPISQNPFLRKPKQ